jgi:hypothetical protein
MLPRIHTNCIPKIGKREITQKTGMEDSFARGAVQAIPVGFWRWDYL